MKKLFCIATALMCILTANSQIFYKISGNGLEKPSYLFGTHHLAPVSITDSIPGLKNALEKEVEQIVGEIDMVSQNMFEISSKMAPYMTAPADSTMTSLIPEDKLSEVNRQLGEIMGAPGMISIQTFDQSRLKPITVSNMVALTLISNDMPGYDPQNQLDSYIQKKGAENGKTIVPLETVEQQSEILFNSTSIRQQLDELLETLAEPDKMLETIKKLNSAYLAHDINAMSEISKESESDNPEFYEKLNSQRNADWMTKLPGIINDKPSLIAVGALHLIGEKSLVNQLRNLGYTVEAID